ncbi:MAG: homoserine O-acetyltransferase [Verrucomicrobiales bacterium]|nr:homoserine O-acetyltransferase [Verrucomicrobiales bacterium]
MQVTTQFFHCREPFMLRTRETLPEFTLAYETYGQLNADRSNGILLFHALTGSQHAAGVNPSVEGVEGRWTEECVSGWWDLFIGPRRALDTEKFFIICVNYLGGCYGSTGPSSVNPLTGRPYGADFPTLRFADIVDSQMKLIDSLGIDCLHAVVGSSVGGIMALSLATRYPQRVKTVVSIGSGHQTSMLQRVLNFEQIFAIESDPNFKAGNYYDGPLPERGLALARMIGHKTFISLDTLQRRARQEIRRKQDNLSWYELSHSVESYMLHQGRKFVKRFDANTYLRVMDAWQWFDLLAEAEVKSLPELFARCRGQRFLVFSIDSDACFYPSEQQELVRLLETNGVPNTHITVHSGKGHDSFLLEPLLYTPHLVYSLSDDWGF